MHYSKVIEKLKLVPLPEEGGFYRETFRSEKLVSSQYLGERSECTCIYYLITEDSFSALHKVDQSEIFHFYAGDPVEMFQFNEAGESNLITIGNQIFEGQVPQVVVPHGAWQGTKLVNPTEGAWALLGCTVAPGFELANFYTRSREDLVSSFPHLARMICKYTNS